MERRFLMAELMILVARALSTSDYAPSAVSARVRAVPDTRTIRYYTTLGLLTPPAEMRGRVAYYNETHVLQIVAIKQLQAQNMSLSDIQQKLVGLPISKLKAIANLTTDFWKAADNYLKSAKPEEPAPPSSSKPKSQDAASNDFWIAPAALPSVPLSAKSQVIHTVSHETLTVIRIAASNGIQIVIELPMENLEKKNLDMKSLLQASKALIEELVRQQLAKNELLPHPF